MSNNKHNADLGKEYNGLHPTMILINMALKYGILQGDYSRGYIEVVKKEANSDICWSEFMRKIDFAKELDKNPEQKERLAEMVKHYIGDNGIFNINVYEVYSTQIPVKANSYEEAVKKVEEMYKKKEIILELDDLTEYKIS